jgi:ABC-type sulfate transport system permease subunit
MVFSNNSFFTLGVLSTAAIISSIPLLTVGYKRMHKSVDTYNNQCVEPDVELALGLTGNGVGMTIRF